MRLWLAARKGIAFAITLLAGFRSFAQNADFSGIILDLSKLAVPNAHVLVENIATAATRVVSSNQQGLYSVPALLPGRYNITVEAIQVALKLVF